MTSTYTGFDKILVDYVGGHGFYQLKTTLIMALPNQLTSLIIYLVVFSADEPKHRCKVSICETEETKGNVFGMDWLDFAIPKGNGTSNFLAEKQDLDSCKMYEPVDNATQCLTESFLGNVTQICSEYVYDTTYFTETLVTKLDLVCERENLKKLLKTILILGLLFGSMVGGWIGDRFGLKKASFLPYLIWVPTVIGAGFVNSFEAYAILHFIYTACLPLNWININVYLTEIYSPGWRYSFTAATYMPLGSLTLAVIAYFCNTWTMIHVSTGVLCALILPLYFCVPESPRWLAQNGYEEKSLKVVLNIAKWNNEALSENDHQEIAAIIQEIANENGHKFEKLTPLDLFKHGQWKTTLILSYTWISVCISYFALSLNSSDLHGDIYINYILSRLTNILVIPAVLGPSIYFGLRLSLAAGQTLLGLSCIGLAFIPKENIITVLIVYLLSVTIATTSTVIFVT